MVIPEISNSLDSHLESHSTVSKRIRGSHTHLYGQGYHMAQSAAKESALLEIEPIWEKPTLEPTLRWDRWQIMLKLAIIAKEGNSIDILLEDPPNKVIYLLNLYTRITLKTAHLRAKEIEESQTSNWRTRG